ncbi:hypothetical protein PR202_ga20844 [Eleusine coracana subsp. coracana]|uniref:DC1 domain-containing protein n=1 Tax=Eleusine coracana subsp. coracana TaxID=191504 RepID=A0AAV5CXN1_ELECO|nr:hypothetical protein PR202_ga20844 [Eleusine coracana subsp. coracana]
MAGASTPGWILCACTLWTPCGLVLIDHELNHVEAGQEQEPEGPRGTQILEVELLLRGGSNPPTDGGTGRIAFGDPSRGSQAWKTLWYRMRKAIALCASQMIWVESVTVVEGSIGKEKQNREQGKQNRTMPATEDVAPPPGVISDHPAHKPGHKLKLKVVANDDDDHFFMCDGCKEPGAGTRYSCEHERCSSFNLHTSCALAPDTLTHPRFGKDRVFLFLLEPPPATTTGNGSNKRSSRVCVACAEDVLGFVYHCFDDGLDLHPCCARQPEHALTDRLVVFALREESSIPRDTSNNDSQRSRENTRRPPVARHRQWPGAPRQDPPPENSRVLELRQEAPPRPADTSGERNRGRERRVPASHYRRLTR